MVVLNGVIKRLGEWRVKIDRSEPHYTYHDTSTQSLQMIKYLKCKHMLQCTKNIPYEILEIYQHSDIKFAVIKLKAHQSWQDFFQSGPIGQIGNIAQMGNVMPNQATWILKTLVKSATLRVRTFAKRHMRFSMFTASFILVSCVKLP